MGWRSKFRDKLRCNRPMVRIFLAELLGTFLLMVLGQAGVAQSVVSGGKFGDYWSITVGYGLAVMVGVSASIGVSGGHINPAVTVSMAMLKRLKWRAVPFYMVGQYLGAFIASVLVYVIYYDAMLAYDPDRSVTGPTATAVIFSTYPQPHVSTWNTFVDQICGTAFLLIGVLALTDPRNLSTNKNQIPFYVGLLVILIGNTYGYNCGYGINPARDLSPRIFTAMAGWGTEVFSHRNYWFWVPLVGPHLGAIAGTLVYQLMVVIHWPDEPETPGTEVEQEPEVVIQEPEVVIQKPEVVVQKPEHTWTVDLECQPTADEISKI